MEFTNEEEEALLSEDGHSDASADADATHDNEEQDAGETANGDGMDTEDIPLPTCPQPQEPQQQQMGAAQQQQETGQHQDDRPSLDSRLHSRNAPLQQNMAQRLFSNRVENWHTLQVYKSREPYEPFSTESEFREFVEAIQRRLYERYKAGTNTPDEHLKRFRFYNGRGKLLFNTAAKRDAVRRVMEVDMQLHNNIGLPYDELANVILQFNLPPAWPGTAQEFVDTGIMRFNRFSGRALVLQTARQRVPTGTGIVVKVQVPRALAEQIALQDFVIDTPGGDIYCFGKYVSTVRQRMTAERTQARSSPTTTTPTSSGQETTASNPASSAGSPEERSVQDSLKSFFSDQSTNAPSHPAAAGFTMFPTPMSAPSSAQTSTPLKAPSTAPPTQQMESTPTPRTGAIPKRQLQYPAYYPTATYSQSPSPSPTSNAPYGAGSRLPSPMPLASGKYLENDDLLPSRTMINLSAGATMPPGSRSLLLGDISGLTKAQVQRRERLKRKEAAMAHNVTNQMASVFAPIGANPLVLNSAVSSTVTATTAAPATTTSSDPTASSDASESSESNVAKKHTTE